MEIITSKQVNANQFSYSNTPPQTSSLSSVEKELDAGFIRALNLLHSTDPDAKHELRRLVDQQIEQAAANQASNKPKSSLIGEIKKPTAPARLKEKSPQVVTTTTTLVSGGVNRLSSSSDDEDPIPPPTRRVTAPEQISHKRIKLAHRDLLGESDDSVDNSTDNDSFEEILKETEKPDLPLHHTSTQKPNNPDIPRPNRPPSKITTAFLPKPVDKPGHSKGSHRLLPLKNLSILHNPRLKNKAGMKMSFKCPVILSIFSVLSGPTHRTV